MRKLITLCFLIVSVGLNAQVLYDTTYFVSIDTQDTILIDGASVLSVDTLELGGVKYTTITGGGGNVDLSWGNNTGVLFETNDTINVSDNNYISGDDLYSTGYHYFDASNKFYISTEPASGNVMYINNDGTNVLQFGSTTSILRSPTGSGLTLLSDELRMTFDSYNFANATNSQNFVTIESASGAGRVNLLGITRPGSAFSDFVVDTNLILTSDTSIYADYIKIDSVGFTDGSWQSTAATGGGGSSSGSAGEIQFSDGSGGFDSDTNFYYENDNVFIKTNLKISDSLYIGDDFYITHAGKDIKYESTLDNLDFIWNTERAGYFKSDGTNIFRYNLGGLFVEKLAYFYQNTTLRDGKYLFFNDASNNVMGEIRGGDNLEIMGSSNSNINFKDTVNFEDTVIFNANISVNGYIEADSIVLINNTYSDIAFEDGYELISIKDAVEYAYQNGSLKGMDRDGMINPVSYINDLELKIEDLYLYTYKQQLEIERLRNLIMVTFLIISVVAVSLFYRHLLR